MRKLFLASASALALALGACSTPTATTPGTVPVPTGADPLITELIKINNAGLAGIQNVENIASVPNASLPGGVEDADMLKCAQQGAQPVLTQTNAVLAAAGKTPGALGYAELASLILPGSIQYTTAQNTLVSACVAKANDVLGPAGVTLAGGVLGAMALNNNILPLAL